jgi:hypothetical protein
VTLFRREKCPSCDVQLGYTIVGHMFGAVCAVCAEFIVRGFSDTLIGIFGFYASVYGQRFRFHGEFMTSPPGPDTLGDTLKFIQIGFYAVGSVTAVLTYRAAKRGLLNSVNTEYQKRVMDRLQKLSDDLYCEFDESSESFWANMQPVKEAIIYVNQQFKTNKKALLSSGTFRPNMVDMTDIKRVRHLLRPVISDPFIPDYVRGAVVDLLETRIEVLHNTYRTAINEYAHALATGRIQPLAGC